MDKEAPKDSQHILEDQILTLEEEEAQPVGNMQPKLNDTIRISSFNPNGLILSKVKPQLSYYELEKIDIQCFSKINQNMNKYTHCKKLIIRCV